MFNLFDNPGLLTGLTIFGLIIWAIGSFFLMKIFDKAGVQGKWRAWVPVYNLMVFSKLGDLSPWLILIAFAATAVLGNVAFIGSLVSLATLVILLMAAWRVGLKLQKGPAWMVLFFFLAIVWYAINALDSSRWNPNVPPAPWASNALLADRTVWQGVPVQTSGATAPPTGYSPPPVGYQPPQPPVGYQPPAGYGQPQAPSGPPVGYSPPPAPSAPPAPSGPPVGYSPPPAPPAAEDPKV